MSQLVAPPTDITSINASDGKDLLSNKENEGNLARVFVLASSNYKKNNINIDLVLESIPTTKNDTEIFTINATEVECASWLDTLHNKPLFTSYCCTVIRHLLKLNLSEKEKSNLAELIAQIPSWGILILILDNEYTEGSAKKTEDNKLESWVKWAKKNSVTILGLEEKNKNIKNAITEYCTLKNIKIEPNAVQYLSTIFRNNTELALLEIDKIINDSELTNIVITHQLLTSTLSHLHKIDTFKLIDEIFCGNICYVESQRYLLDEATNLDEWLHTHFLPVFTKQLTLIWQAITINTLKDYPNYQQLIPSKPSISSEPSWIKNKIQQQSKMWNITKIAEVYQHLATLDNKLKGIESGSSTKDEIINLMFKCTFMAKQQ